MDPKRYLKGKRVLIADDEEDILESLVELLEMCEVDTAKSFEEAKELLEDNFYHIAVLGIMGGGDTNSWRSPTERISQPSCSRSTLY